MSRKMLPSTLSIFSPFFEDEEWFPTTGFREDSGLTVSEDEKSVTVEAAMPGLKPDQTEVVYQKGVLWIKGQKQEEESDKQKKFYRKASSSFSYSVAIPGKIDESQEPEASFEDGVMKVQFKKAETETPKRIQIKSK